MHREAELIARIPLPPRWRKPQMRLLLLEFCETQLLPLNFVFCISAFEVASAGLLWARAPPDFGRPGRIANSVLSGRFQQIAR